MSASGAYYTREMTLIVLADIPFELDEPFEFGKNRYAFRVRMDKINVDSTLVNERLRELVKHELEMTGKMGPRIRKKLNISSATELVRVAIRNGVVKL